MSNSLKDDARRTVEKFIQAINERNAAAASALVSEGFQMTFSGNTVMRTVDEFFTWLQGRTPQSRYDYRSIDIAETDAGLAVYASGTATGTTVSGLEFTGVRIIDKFVIQNGKIVTKEAWSDMADFLRRAAG